MSRRRVLIITGILVALLLFASYVIAPHYIMKMIRYYKPYTFERVLENDTLRHHYGIGEKSNPADYGFSSFSEIELNSIHDGNRLSSWFVPASQPSKKTVLIIHGRWSNRLKTMKYLEIFKSSGLDSLYNIMIPDMRNSGRSEESFTMMGYEFAEDIVTNMLWLAEEQEQSEVVLYGFSMGAMAVAIVFNRPELMEEIDRANLEVDRIILDSPVANVSRILRLGAEDMGLPGFIFDQTLTLLHDQLDGFGQQMKLSLLLKDLKFPILILQGTGDDSQPLEILKDELNELNNTNIQIEFFEEGEHVLLYQTPVFKSRYTKIVAGFLSE